MEESAYGYMIDSTYKQAMSELCADFNRRSIRHASMSEEERRADDFNTAWNEVIANREAFELAERKRYRGHRIQDIGEKNGDSC